MKSSSRTLLLVPAKGEVNKKRRYFNMKNALKKAVELNVDERINLTIYDTERGVDLVTVSRNNTEVVAVIHSPRLFSKHWSA